MVELKSLPNSESPSQHLCNGVPLHFIILEVAFVGAEFDMKHLSGGVKRPTIVFAMAD